MSKTAGHARDQHSQRQPRRLARAVFAAGTVPALVAVGWGGLMLRRRLRDVARWIAPPLLVANAALMLALAGIRL